MPQNYSITPANSSLSTQLNGTHDDWLSALDVYRVQFIILNIHGEGDVVKFLRSQPGWEVDFEDDEAIIFARADMPERHPIRGFT